MHRAFTVGAGHKYSSPSLFSRINVTLAAAPQRQLFVPAFVSHIDPLQQLPRSPAPRSPCAAAHQQRPAAAAPVIQPPSARDVVQSLVMQMSPERLEKARLCEQPYFAADSMIAAYIHSRINFCENLDPQAALGRGSTSLGSTRISCLPLDAASQLDKPTLCEAHAVSLHLPLLTNSANHSPWLRLQHGALVGSCTRQRVMPPKALTHCLSDWFEQAFSENGTATCDEWVDGDTYIVTRHDSLSPWYTLLDMWFAFLSAAVFKLQPHSSRVIFADAQPPGAALSYWSAAFTSAAPISLQQLAKQAMRRGVRRLCFKRAIFNPPAATSALEHGYQHVLGHMACSDNLLLQAHAAHTRALMNAGDAPPPHASSSLSLFILKDSSLPPSSRDLFAQLQRHFASSLSITVANVERTSFSDVVNSLARASILLSTSDAAAAFALYLRPLSACISLQFDEAPLLHMQLVTAWARIAHYR
jgi:hypothetical protein